MRDFSTTMYGCVSAVICLSCNVALGRAHPHQFLGVGRGGVERDEDGWVSKNRNYTLRSAYFIALVRFHERGELNCKI